jgi:hypothetical protein
MNLKKRKVVICVLLHYVFIGNHSESIDCFFTINLLGANTLAYLNACFNDNQEKLCDVDIWHEYYKTFYFKKGFIVLVKMLISFEKEWCIKTSFISLMGLMSILKSMTSTATTGQKGWIYQSTQVTFIFNNFDTNMGKT